jgi:RND family efflux transporter MFP subunit
MSNQPPAPDTHGVTVQLLSTLDLGPEIEGNRIVEILVEEGDSVAQGQVLARLARDTLDAQLAQSTAQLARADAGVAQARSSIAQAQAAIAQSGPALDRAKSLVKTGAGTDATLEARTADHTANLARLQAARDGLAASEADKKALEAQRRELEVRVARTEVKAPAAGLVSRRMARLGAIASMAGEGMFRIIAGGDVELEAEAPDFRLAAIKVGQTATVYDAADRPLAARVRLVSPEIDRATRMGKLRIAVGPDAGLRIGGFARGEIETERRVALTAPASAILVARDGRYVQAIKEGRVSLRKVETGLSVGGLTEIRSGLAEGETLVARAGAFLNDGDPVETRAEPTQANAEIR